MIIKRFTIHAFLLLSLFTHLHARDLNVSFGSSLNSGADNPDGKWYETQNGILYDSYNSAKADNLIIATDDTKMLDKISLGYDSKSPNLDIRFAGSQTRVASNSNTAPLAPPSSYGIAKVANSLSTAFSEHMSFGSSSITLTFSNLTAGKYSFSFLSGFLTNFQVVTDTPSVCNLNNVSMTYGTCETNRGGNQKDWFNSGSVNSTSAEVAVHNPNWALNAVAGDINGVEITENGGSFSIILNTENTQPRDTAMMMLTDGTETQSNIADISLSAIGLSREAGNIPEPSTALLSLLGFSGYLLRRRRK